MNRSSYGYITAMIAWTSGAFIFGDVPIWSLIIGFTLLSVGTLYMTIKHSNDPKCAKCVEDER